MHWRLEVLTDDSVFDAIVNGGLESATKDLVEELRHQGAGDGPVRLDGVDVTSVDSLAELELRNGSVLDARTRGSSARAKGEAESTTGLHLVALYGPDAGRRWPLRPGTWIIGRSESADLRVDDPLMSGRHASVAVIENDAGLSVEITDLESTNGSAIEDARLTSVEEILIDSYVQLGSSVFSVVSVADVDRAVVGTTPGPDVALQRRFREAAEPLPRRLTPPTPPNRSEGTPAAWWRSLMPLITGAGFAYLTGRWQFLLVMALAPILFTFDVVRRKRKKKAADAADQERYEFERAQFDAQRDELRSEERARRRSAAIGGGAGALMSTVCHRRIWERRVTDDDFGRVTIGLAALPSAIEAGDTDEVDGPPRPWGAPLETSLIETGSLSVLGDGRRTPAILRSIVLGLATAHSPADVRLWVFAAADAGAEWRFARWLPHAFSGPATSAIACEPSDRAAQFAALKQELETRLDRRNGGGDMELPLHVAVFSHADLVGQADLADVLTRGADVGIVGIVADSRIAPEGVGATLTLGDTADDAAFESRDHPRVGGIRTAEMHPSVADEAARRLASLRPTIDDRTGGMGGVVHLTDLLGIEGLTPSELNDRWGRMSPQTAATIGVASDTPMVIDIAEHGPHGLVGGMSGSGKTEFLMTLLTSLCLNNHPDDLAISIVDFKGGVDHALTSKLPHVIGLSTNLEIDEFKRTIDLLDAEQRRRQALLAGVGGDIDAYRTARLTRPELPALPRLLVVVDEFSELLASEDGKQRLQDLVRVTRIGRALGVHLLLVTQNFEGQLPPQVEANAGLRVCLRVMKPSHSKVVLDSDAASGISDASIGRAFARLNGRDLVEFQTARVAGQRRDLAAGPPPVVVHRTTIETLCKQTEQRREGKPPTEETDMHGLIATLWDAARASGWERSAVPWPADLSSDVDLRSLMTDWNPTAGSAPVALQDRPAEQTQSVLALDPEDEHVLLLGGPSADLVSAQTTIAVALTLLHTPDEQHLHAIDLEGGALGGLGALPHSGTIAVRDEALSLQLLRYLVTEVAERRAAMVAAGVSTLSALSPNDPDRDRPTITLLVNGADRLVRRGDDTRSGLLAPLQSLLADSSGTGVRVILAGLPSIADSRLGQNIERRFVFAMPGDTKASTYGAPRELCSSLSRPGRCVDVNAQRLTQFAGVADVAGIGQRLCASQTASRHAPKTFVTVTWPFPMSNIDIESLSRPAGFGLPIPIGVEVESGTLGWVDGDEDGPVFTVAGGTKSGRSSALTSIATMARTVGWQTVAVVGSRRSPLAEAPDVVTGSPFDAVCQPDRLQRVLEALPADRPTLIMFDDLHRVDASMLDLAGVFDSGRPTAALIAGPPEFLSGRDAAFKAFPAPRGGLLLAPTGFGDGAAIGLSGRLSDEHRSNPRAGRGLLAVAGEAREIQIAL